MTASEWPSEKNRPTEIGRLPSCISLRTTLSIGGDVIGIDGVTQAQHIGEEGGTEKRRPLGERDRRPGPGRDVDREQKNIDRDDLRALIGRRVVDRRLSGK